MNTCKTCAHWRAYTGPGKQQVGGYCQSEKIIEDREGRFEPDALVYSYCEGGRFWTGPEFGCVHHTPTADSAPDSPKTPVSHPETTHPTRQS